MASKTRHERKHLGEDRMNTSKKFIAFIGLLSVRWSIPTMAQISNKVTFDAPFAFYAGNAKMPAGSYTITQPDIDDNLFVDRRHHRLTLRLRRVRSDLLR